MEIDKDFGDRVEYMRLQENISPQQLSNMTSLSIRTLRDIRYKGLIPKASSIEKIAKALNTSSDWLMNGEKVDLFQIESFDVGTIVENVKNLMFIRGYTIEKLAKKAKMSETCVQMFLSRRTKPMLSTISRIAKAFEMTERELAEYKPVQMCNVLSYGERLKALIFGNGYTEQKIAELCEVDEIYIKQLKADKCMPRVELQDKLANALNVTRYQLLTGDGIDDYLKQEVFICLKEYSPDISIRVKEERSKQGISLTDLACRAGLSINGLANVENGRVYPRYESIRRIAIELQVPVSELIERKIK